MFACDKDDPFIASGLPQAAEGPVTVSVIIPVYNVGKYISQCIESVIRQTYPHLEILVIDDGSTDDSGGICDAFARSDDRIRVFHTQNRGLSSARNLGLDHVTGSYIMFLDGDDWIEPDTAVTFLQTSLREKADIVVAGIWKEYVNQTVVDPRKTNGPLSVRGEEILTAFAEGYFTDRVWDRLYSAACFNHIRFPEGHNFEDVATTWKVVKELSDRNGSVAVIPDRLIHFRMRQSSISHTNSLKNISDYWKASLDKYDSFPGRPISFLKMCYAVICRMWVSYSGLTKEEQKDAAGLLSEMQRFAKDHSEQIMKSDCSGYIKMLFLVLHCKARPVLRLCYCRNRLKNRSKNRKFVLFE